MDGIPGRSGFDGNAGSDGIPGLPGSPGIPGTNGKDGRKGELGPRGVRGPQGERGLPGNRGNPGKNGKDGSRGEPGISLWSVPGAKSEVDLGLGGSEAILIPPAISDGGTRAGRGRVKRVTVIEGANFKLTCVASGIPRPKISWTREDGKAIPDGVWRSETFLLLL